MLVFIDSNVFIFGLDYEETNSRTVLNLAEEKEFEVCVSELVLREVGRFFLRNYDEKRAYYALKYIESLAEIVPEFLVKNEMKKYSNKISEKDLPNLACAKYRNAGFIIAVDRDYEGIKEYATPKEFLRKIKRVERIFDSDY